MAKKNNSAVKLRHRRIRKKISGTAARPRLAVHFSSLHIYAQIIDDAARCTITSANTTEKSVRSQSDVRANIATAVRIGKLLADRAKEKNISTVVFDRGGFIYHGKVKALADAARDAGLQF
jgi:large subunit ribosomal protein L18